MVMMFFEEVSYFCKKLIIAWACNHRLFWFFRECFIHDFYHDKDRKGNNNKVDNRLHKESIFYHGISESVFESFQIDTTSDDTYERHDDIGYDGRNDFSECGTDDHSDSKIDDISLDRECLEFLENTHNEIVKK